MDGEQQIRAAALEAASRIVAENLPKFINLGRLGENKANARMATLDLAKEFERYIQGGTA